jgi:hypothetical protein
VQHLVENYLPFVSFFSLLLATDSGASRRQHNMAISGHKLLSILVFSGLGVYSGVKFFEPLVVEQLRKDGNLRGDIEVPQFDQNGERIIGGVDKSLELEKLRERLEAKKE